MHNHQHCCEHLEVKYCKVCKVAYCVKCGKEWRENVFWYYPNWTYTWGTGATSGYEVTTSCSHKE